MSYIQNFFTSRDNNANTEAYVGQKDRLWYNPDKNSIRVSDGVTPGGLVVDLETTANATFNSVTANSGTINGNLIVLGNISPAAVGKIGGVQPGPGANISNTGLLTIDTTGLPLSFGDFTASNNVLTVVNADEDMILQTSGNAEIQLVGNIGFYKPDGIPPNVANRYLSATSDGQLYIYVSNVDVGFGAVNIIGSTSTATQSPVNPGVMLQITGQNDIPSRLYNDGIGGYSGFIARRYNNTAASPTQVLNNDEIARFGINGYKTGGWLTAGQARISFVSTDNQDNANNGAKIEFWSTPKGNTTANITKVMSLDATYGANVTGNLSVTGNITGNLSGTILTANLITGTLTTNAQPNITSVGNLTSLDVTGNITTGNLVIPTGNIIYTPRYGSFYSNVDQTNPVANTAMAMTFNNTSSANSVSVVSNSRLTIAKPGVYNIQFSAQVAKTGGGTGYVDIWLNKNGAPVDWTNGTVPVVSGAPVIASWNYVENVTVANTYYEIMWSSADNLTLLDATAANTNPTRPGIPSVIVTVTPVGA